MVNDKQKKFLIEMGETNVNPEEFIDHMRLFSQYLVYSNPDYQYNETYLENLCLDFIEFGKYFKTKNKVFGKIIQCLLEYNQELDLQLSVDELWIYASSESAMYVNSNINIKLVCREKIIVKAILVYESIRYLFLKEYDAIKQEKLVDNIENVISNDVMQWIEDIHNGEDKK